MDEIETSSEVVLAEIEQAVLPSNAAGLEEAEKSKLGDRMKRAMRHVACGMSAQEASAAVGYANRTEVGRVSKRFNICSHTSERIVARIKDVAALSMEELESRLTEDPKQFAPKELAVVAGIATDKIAKKERWGMADDRPEGHMSALEQLADAAAKGLISMDIQVRPAPSAAQLLEPSVDDEAAGPT